MTTTPKRPLLSTFVIAAISLASPLLSSSAHANLVVNGGFEHGVDSTPFFGVAAGTGAPTTGWAADLPALSPIPVPNLHGWTTGPVQPNPNPPPAFLVTGVMVNNSGDPLYGQYYATGTGNGPHSGLVAAVFSNTNPYDAYITQAIATTNGQLYRLSYWLSNQIGDVGDENNMLTVKWGGVTQTAHEVNNPLVEQPTVLTVPMGWTQYYVDVEGTGGEVALRFTGGSDPGAILLDDVSLIAVPEVSSFGMLTGLGLLAFGTAARFRRRSFATA